MSPLKPIHLMAILAVMLLACVDLAQAESEGLRCDFGQNEDAGAPDAEPEDANKGTGIWYDPDYLNTWPTAPTTWRVIRCDTCYMPCGFGPPGCLRPIKCCGERVGENLFVDERPDP